MRRWWRSSPSSRPSTRGRWPAAARSTSSGTTRAASCCRASGSSCCSTEGIAFLELSPLAGWGTDFPVGASLVTGIGVVEGVECLITANDPTVKGGASNPWTVKKAFRRREIAEENRLPDDHPRRVRRRGPADPEGDLHPRRRSSSATSPGCRRGGIPTIALVFGNSTAGGAYVPGMSDHVVMVKEQAQGLPRRPAAGEDGDRRGVRRRVARRRRDARPGLRPRRLLRRRRARRDPHRPPDRRPAQLAQAGSPARPARGRAEPRLDEDELLGIVPADLKEPFDPREVIVRIVTAPGRERRSTSSSRSTARPWSPAGRRLHGYPIGILANAQGVLFSEESQKAAQFIQLANQLDTPLLFLHNTTGYMVGAEYEQGGIIKHGAMMINAVATARSRTSPCSWVRPTAPGTTACAGAPTTRASCSPGPAPSPR